MVIAAYGTKQHPFIRKMPKTGSFQIKKSM
jgi:hypothetical protein